MSKFDIESQYQLYLNKMGLNESVMPPTQRTETRRAFMGGMSQMLILLRDDIASLEEDLAVAKMEELLYAIQAFWLKEAKK